VPVTRPLPPLPDAPVNRFRNSFDSTPTETLTLIQALETIRTGYYRSEVRLVRAILAHRGKAAYDKAKAQLSAFTFGGVFAPSRGNAHRQQHTGIVHGDLDHLSDVAAVKQAICSHPCTVYAFVSPSGGGLKLWVHVPVVADTAGYKHAWHTVSIAYERRYGGRWDPSGKDISRLRFVSHDPTLYWNPEAVVFEIPPEPVPESRRLIPSQPSVSRASDDRQGYAEQAIRTAAQMIEAAELGTRHYTRLKAACLLGGYVAGGLLNEDQAYGALAQALVGHTNNLQRSLKTVQDGLAYGEAHPITIEALEAERQAWLDANRAVAHNGRTRQAHHSANGDEQSLILLPLRPYAPYRGPRKGAWHG
jgi:hypothetical protein